VACNVAAHAVQVELLLARDQTLVGAPVWRALPPEVLRRVAGRARARANVACAVNPHRARLDVRIRLAIVVGDLTRESIENPAHGSRARAGSRQCLVACVLHDRAGQPNVHYKQPLGGARAAELPAPPRALGAGRSAGGAHYEIDATRLRQEFQESR